VHYTRNMYDVDAIEAINFEQLATATDRLLLRGGRLAKRRPSTNRLAELARPHAFARGSQPVIEVPELTVVTRPRRRSAAAAATLVVSSVLVAFAAVVTLV